ncbi:hypothetical protein BZG36_00987 [Bifiguratus adelaidae]|uniref:DDHD domain-containing protein n=1 Tax=Bifiguratus adelaidae TaxID=1938954 RepID=A0A261Y687_9FUNG|nr:hypothetical protein BZG36_00987 [Bifiguratus adelaidae]
MFSEATVIPSVSPSTESELLTPPDRQKRKDKEGELSSDIEVSEDAQALQDQAIDHLQTEQYGHFYEHMEEIRETTRQVLQAKMPERSMRIELIPIEYHKALHALTDQDMQKITLKSIPTIRLIENDYLADAMYYMTKARGQWVVEHVTQLFNSSYTHFMEQHPDFKGRVAIFGYSLGGIVTWDMLSNQRPLTDELTEDEKDNYAQVDFKIPKLVFRPDFFFALGSPISAILVFRNQSPLLYHPPTDVYFENIFHPFDPLGYRFEPLCFDDYIEEPAVLVDKCLPIMGMSMSMPGFGIPSFMSGVGFFSGFFGTSKQEQQDVEEEPPEQKTPHERKASESYLGAAREKMMAVVRYLGGSRSDASEQARKDEERIRCLRLLTSKSPDQIVVRRRSESDLEQVLRSVGVGASDHPDSTSASSRSATPPPEPKQEETDDQRQVRLKRAEWQERYANEMKRGFLTSGLVTSLRFDDERSDEQFDYFSVPTASSPSKGVHKVEMLDNDGRPKRPAQTRRRSRDLFQDFRREMGGDDDRQKRQGRRQSVEISPELPPKRHSHHDVLSDLNKELAKPGRAFYSQSAGPQGEAVVAGEASVPGEGDQEPNTEAEAEQSKPQKSLPLPYRIDFVLQPESFMDMIANEYLVGFRAHFSYWTNKDLIWHILRRMEDISRHDPHHASVPHSDIVDQGERRAAKESMQVGVGLLAANW